MLGFSFKGFSSSVIVQISEFISINDNPRMDSTPKSPIINLRKPYETREKNHVGWRLNQEIHYSIRVQTQDTNRTKHNIRRLIKLND